MAQNQISQRYEWVDLFKALAIICVVMGHVGLGSIYIYQFHMATFFFISGYTAQLEKKSFGEVFCKKFYQLLIPFFTLFIVVDIAKFILLKGTHGAYGFGYVQQGFLVTFIEFFKGRVYIDVLGATWFLSVLFGVFTLQKIVLVVLRNKIGITYFLISIAELVLGYTCVLIGRGARYNLDLILIAQIFFSIGMMANQVQLKHKKESFKAIKYVVAIVVIGIMGYSSRLSGSTVNYTTREFKHLVLNTFLGLNGIVLLYILSTELSRLSQKVKEPIISIGQNSMGILFLHFIMFKPIFLLEAVMCIKPYDYIKNLTPDTGDSFKLLMIIFSIGISVIVWRCLLKHRIARILLGKDQTVYHQLFGKIQALLDWMEDRFNTILATIYKRIPRLLVVGCSSIFVLLCITQYVVRVNKMLNTKEMSITQVTPAEIVIGSTYEVIAGRPTLSINGKNFKENDIIYVNGKACETTFGNSTWLTCFVEIEDYESLEDLQIKVCRISGMDIVGESNEVFILKH